MAKDPFEPFTIPTEMRAFAERSVAQAREAFTGFVDAATKAVGQMQGSAQAAQSGAAEIAQKSISYAEQNVAATFDFPQPAGLFTIADLGGWAAVKKTFFDPDSGVVTKLEQGLGVPTDS